MKLTKNTIMFVLVLTLGFMLVGCNKNSAPDYDLNNVKNAYITIDINPSIEIITGDTGMVVQVNGLNNDAIRLLIETNFEGKTVDEVIEAILQLALDFGYLNFDVENAILISTVTSANDESEALERKVSQKVQDFINQRKIRVQVLKASFSATEDIKAKAEEYNISVGKVKLITCVLAIDSSLTFEEAAKMSVRDLLRIIQEDRNEIKEFFSEEIRQEYLRLKDHIKNEYMLKIKEFINTQIQAASDEVFEEILAQSSGTVQDIKDLYQEYYNALLEAIVPDVTEEDGEENTEIKTQLEELKKLLEELNKELKELTEEIRKRRPFDITAQELEDIFERIKEITLQRQELTKQINELKALLEKNLKDRLGEGFPGNWQDRLDRIINEVYREIHDDYRKRFEKINVKMEELEELIMELFRERIKEFMDDLKREIQNVRDQLKTDSLAVREQIRQENEILKEIWRNKKK